MKPENMASLVNPDRGEQAGGENRSRTHSEQFWAENTTEDQMSEKLGGGKKIRRAWACSADQIEKLMGTEIGKRGTETQER
jgi:hypothetical protein